MVKKLMKFFAYFLFFVGMLLLFIPKESVYFLAEQKLKESPLKLIISKERLTDNFFSLNISNLEITANDIDSALINEVDITLLGLYNSLHFSKIELSSVVEAYLPSKIEELDINYTILNPLKLSAHGVGEFGEASATVSLLDRNASVTLKPSKKMHSKYRNSLRFFKKTKGGEYIYAKTF